MKTGSNIRQRADGRFEARYIKERTPEGKIVYGYCYGQTYDEAAAKRELAAPKTAQMKVPNLLILGAGSHGQETKELAESLRLFKKIDFLDDDINKQGVIGTPKDMKKFLPQYPMAFPAVGDKNLRIRWTAELVEAGFIIPTLIHPSAVISRSSEIEDCSIIFAGAVISTGAFVGKGSIISDGAMIGRGAKVAAWSLIDTGEAVIAKSGEK